MICEMIIIAGYSVGECYNVRIQISLQGRVMLQHHVHVYMCSVCFEIGLSQQEVCLTA